MDDQITRSVGAATHFVNEGRAREAFERSTFCDYDVSWVYTYLQGKNVVEIFNDAGAFKGYLMVGDDTYATNEMTGGQSFNA